MKHTQRKKKVSARNEWLYVVIVFLTLARTTRFLSASNKLKGYLPCIYSVSLRSVLACELEVCIARWKVCSCVDMTPNSM